jgi:hypothetical protein
MREVTRITPIRADTTPEDTAVRTRAGITGTPEPATITRIISMARTLILVLIGCAVLSMAAAAFAGDQAKDTTNSLEGIGGMTCAEYAQAFRANPGGITDIMFAWAGGWISGVNAWSVISGAGYRDVTPLVENNFMTELNYYCDQNPLRQVWQAVGESYGKLPLIPNDISKKQK